MPWIEDRTGLLLLGQYIRNCRESSARSFRSHHASWIRVAGHSDNVGVPGDLARQDGTLPWLQRGQASDLPALNPYGALMDRTPDGMCGAALPISLPNVAGPCAPLPNRIRLHP